MFGERGVLRPGQTLVERNDSGLCVSRQCSRSLDPASGFYLLRTSSINCSAHCQPVRPACTPVTPHTDRILNDSSSGGRTLCLFLPIFNIFRIRSTRHQKISQHVAAFARTFPASTNTRTAPPFSTRSNWFSRILVHVPKQALRF